MRLVRDWGGNRTVLALSAARFGDAVGNSILFVVIPLYVASLPASWLPLPDVLRAALLLSIYGFISALLQPLAGAWVDWAGRRKLFIQGGLAVAALAILGFMLASHFGELLALRIVQGIGLALTIPASLALLATHSERRTRGGSMGFYTTARLVGFSLGPLIGGALLDTVGFAPAFYTAAGFIAAAIVLVQLWVREETPAPRSEGARPYRPFDFKLLSAGIVGSGLAVFAMASAFSMMTPLEKEFNERLQQGAFAFGAAFSVLMVSRLVLQVPVGRLSDRIGRKRVIVAGLLIMAPATALMGGVSSTLELVVLRIAQGVGSAGVAAPAFALAADLTTAGNAARQMSITAMGFGLGIAAGPLIAGTLAIVSFELPFIAAAILLVAAAWVIHRYVPEPARGEE